MFVDNQGAVFLNEDFVLTSFKLEVMERAIRRRQKLIGELRDCPDEKCLARKQQEMDQEVSKHQILSNNILRHQQEKDRKLLLCNDLYVESDIAFCKKTVKVAFVEQMREEFRNYL